MDQWVTAFTQGGAIAVLVVGFGLVLTGRIRSKPGYDAEVGLWRERLADLVVDRDEWKAQARAAIAAVDRLSDALEARNRRDERTVRRDDSA